MAKTRQREENVYQQAMGKDVSFEEYLKGDRDYQKAMGDRRKREEEAGGK